MRVFNNEDIILSREASELFLRSLFATEQKISEFMADELQNMSSEETEDGMLYQFPDWDINLDEIENERIEDSKKTVEKTKLTYCTHFSMNCMNEKNNCSAYYRHNDMTKKYTAFTGSLNNKKSEYVVSTSILNAA